MSIGHQPLPPGKSSAFAALVKSTLPGKSTAPVAASWMEIRYPHPHREGAIVKHLEFLVHGEAFQDAFRGAPMSDA
jgi:hypothetical protein